MAPLPRGVQKLCQCPRVQFINSIRRRLGFARLSRGDQPRPLRGPADESSAFDVDVDRRTLKGTRGAATLVGTITAPPEEDECFDEDRRARIARGVAAGEGEGDAGGSAQSAAQAHLLFVSTSHGYQLLERRGRAPAAFEYVWVPEHDGLFRVAKLVKGVKTPIRVRTEGLAALCASSRVRTVRPALCLFGRARLGGTSCSGFTRAREYQIAVRGARTAAR
jgi:hypothetical protein